MDRDECWNEPEFSSARTRPAFVSIQQAKTYCDLLASGRVPREPLRIPLVIPRACPRGWGGGASPNLQTDLTLDHLRVPPWPPLYFTPSIFPRDTRDFARPHPRETIALSFRTGPAVFRNGSIVPRTWRNRAKVFGIRNFHDYIRISSRPSLSRLFSSIERWRIEVENYRGEGGGEGG